MSSNASLSDPPLEIFLRESRTSQRKNGLLGKIRVDLWTSCTGVSAIFPNITRDERDPRRRPRCLNRSFSVGLPNVLHDATAGYLHLYRLHLCNRVHSYFDHISVRIAITSLSLSLSLFLCTLFGMITAFGMKRDSDIIYRLAKNRLESTASVKRYLSNTIDNSLGKFA